MGTALPREARHIQIGRNPGDVLDPYILAATQNLLCGGDSQRAIEATVAHKALMVLEGLLGHLHEEVLGRMRGNVRAPEPRGELASRIDPATNPFPGADVVTPPLAEGGNIRFHQVKSKTGSMNSSGGHRLALQLVALQKAYPGSELYSHSLVGTTLNGHRTMGVIHGVSEDIICTVGKAAFRLIIRFLGITRTGLHIFFMTQPGLRLVVAEVILPNRHGRGMRFDLDRR